MPPDPGRTAAATVQTMDGHGSAWKSPRTIPNIVRQILARIQDGPGAERLAVAVYSPSETCWYDQSDNSRTPVHIIAWTPIPPFTAEGEMPDKTFEDIMAALGQERYFRHPLISAEVSAAWAAGERSATRIAAQVLKSSWHIRKILGAAR